MTWRESNRLIVNLPLDIQNWQKYYHPNQQEYIPRRLGAVKFFCEGKPRLLIIKELNITYKRLRSRFKILIKPFEHYTNHGNINHTFTIFSVFFIIFG